MDQGGASGFQQPPFNLYGGPGGQGAADPYFYNPPVQSVSLSGKIGPSTESTTSAANPTSLISSVTAAVETSYQSARNVVFGSADTASPSGGFGLLSLGYQQIINFAICIALGAFFMFLAFLFLPMVVLAPQKFTLLFTLGSVSWITGLAMLHGPKSLMLAMINRERIPFTAAYGASLIGTFYACLFAHSYLLTMLFAVVQIAALMAFIVSYFPGGTRMLGMVKDLILNRVKNLFGMGGGSSSVLPL